MGGGGRQGIRLHHAFFLPLRAQHLILEGQETGGQRHGLPGVHQGAQEPALAGRVPGDSPGLGPEAWRLAQKKVIQGMDLFRPFHQSSSFPGPLGRFARRGLFTAQPKKNPVVMSR